jgi:hypothetical protein
MKSSSNEIASSFGCDVIYIFKENDVGFEILAAVVMKNSVFWDTTLCNPSKVNRRFGLSFRLYLQDRRIRHARNQREAGSKPRIEATYPSETSVDFQRTTHRCIA